MSDLIILLIISLFPISCVIYIYRQRFCRLYRNMLGEKNEVLWITCI